MRPHYKYPAIEETIGTILDLKLACPEEIEGCTPDQIREVEDRYGLLLPGIYKEYLAVMGRKAGKYQAGTSLRYPTVLRLRESAEELLAEDKASVRLPEDAFVFLMHQGYQFMFFHADGVHEDPPIYWYMEGANKFVEHDPSFSHYLRRVVHDLQKIYQNG